MSFLSGPECSTAANSLAQFQKQTAQDTSLQRDRLTNRNGSGSQFNGFRSQPAAPQDAAFQDFANQGAQHFSPEALPQDPFYAEQLRRETESGGQGWAGEFAQHAPPQQFNPSVQQRPLSQSQSQNGFTPQDFAQFQHLTPRTSSPAFSPQQSAYASRPPMYGSNYGGGGAGFGMQQRSAMFQPMQAWQPQEVQGKGKGRVQELSDTDWERQFEELSTQDQGVREEGDLDEEAERAIERELDQADR